MNADAMDTEAAREALSRMILEMQNTMNAIGDYPDTDDEDTDNEPTKIPKATPTAPTTVPIEASSSTTPAEKKKKKKKKSKSSKKPKLEDYEETDALEASEDPYDRSKSVAERVELAVTRFRKNRKFDTTRCTIFSVYLNYGGIKTGQKSFQGGGVATGGAHDDGDPDFEAMNAGIDRVEEPNEDQTIDFENVATTFLSEFFLNSSGWIEAQYYTDTPLVVAALMNYLLVRNVLPEHEDDIKRALAVAKLASDELPRIKTISKDLPGRFDKACSLMFGGEFYGILDTDPNRDCGWSGLAQKTGAFGMDMPFAERLVKSKLAKGQELSDITVQPREYLEMEVIQVELQYGTSTLVGNSMSVVSDLGDIEARVEAMVDHLFATSAQATKPIEAGKGNTTSTEGQSWPLPELVCVTFAEWDYERSREDQLPLECRRNVKAYFEKAAAEAMLPGMRASAYVYTMSNGVSYLEQARFYPTYYLEADRIEVDDWNSDEDGF